MKNGERFFSIVFVGVCTFLLAACGGGGGDSDSGDGGNNPPPVNQGPPPTYSGRTEPAEVNRESAVKLAQIVVDSLSLYPMIESLWVDTPYGVEEQKQTVEGSGGGSVEMALEPMGSGTSRVTMTFNRFMEGGLTLDGVLEQTQNSNFYDCFCIEYSPVYGTMKFDRLELSGQGLDFMMHGTVSGVEHRDFEFDLLLEDRSSGESAKLENLSLRRSILSTQFIGYGELLVTEISGSLYDSGLGRIDIATSRPIYEFEVDEETGVPAGEGNGLIDVQGDGPAMQLMAVNRKYVGVLLDEDEDGNFGVGLRTTWRQLVGLEPFEQHDSGSPPVANPGIDFTTKVDWPTFVHGLYSHDADNQFLEFYWKRSPEINAQSSTIKAAYFEFTAGETGERLETLKVSDGQNTSESTMKITVTDRLSYKNSPIPTTRGQLEVQPSEDGGRYTLDANSAIHEDGDGVSVILEEGEGYSLQDNGDNTFTLYNPDALRGVAEIYSVSTAPFRGDTTTRFNIGYDRFEVSHRFQVDSYVSHAITPVDFDGNGTTDLLRHATDQFLSYPDNHYDTHYLAYYPRYTTENTSYFYYKRPVEAGSSYLTTGDINNDGWVDAVTFGLDGVYVSPQVLEASPFESVSHELGEPEILDYQSLECIEEPVNLVDPTSSMIGAAIADLDGDGYEDLVAAFGCEAAHLMVWRGTEDGTLAEAGTTVLVDAVVLRVEFADFNEDGLQDLVLLLCEQDYSCVAEVKVFLNTGDGFAESFAFSEEEVKYPDIEVVDFSGDGRPDLLYKTSEGVSLLRQQAADAFTQVAGLDISLWDAALSASAADLDSDGLVDLVMGGSGSLWVTVNEGEQRYSTIPLMPDSTGIVMAGLPAVIDINNEGTPDIAVPSRDGFTVFYGDLHRYSTPVGD